MHTVYSEQVYLLPLYIEFRKNRLENKRETLTYVEGEKREGEGNKKES
jgi:hypothetical protein